MKVVEKIQKVFEAKPFIASRPKEDWPEGVVEIPGSGWFLKTPKGEVGLSDGDWIVGGEAISADDFQARFVTKASVDKVAGEKAVLEVLGAKVLKERKEAKTKEKAKELPFEQRLSQMTKLQLEEFARERYGEEVDRRVNKEDIISQVLAWDETHTDPA